MGIASETSLSLPTYATPAITDFDSNLKISHFSSDLGANLSLAAVEEALSTQREKFTATALALQMELARERKHNVRLSMENHQLSKRLRVLSLLQSGVNNPFFTLTRDDIRAFILSVMGKSKGEAKETEFSIFSRYQQYVCISERQIIF